MAGNSLIPSPKRGDLFFPLEQQFNRFFQDFFKDIGPSKGLSVGVGFPKLNVYEHGGKFHVVASVSGVTEDELSVEVTEDHTLVIAGRMSSVNHTPDGAEEHVRELRMSAFERRMHLPDNLFGEPEATLKDGLLHLTWEMPRGEVQKAPKKIPIKSG